MNFNSEVDSQLASFGQNGSKLHPAQSVSPDGEVYYEIINLGSDPAELGITMANGDSGARTLESGQSIYGEITQIDTRFYLGGTFLCYIKNHA